MDEKWQAILMELFADPDLKDQFMEDPALILKSRGYDIPPGVTVKALEDTKTVRHIILPFLSEDVITSSEELEQRVSKDVVLPQ